MQSGTYWTNKLIGRRAALRGAAAAGTGLAALSLVGCGGSSSSTTSAPKPPVKQEVAMGPLLDSAEGKPGGTIKYYESNFPPNFNVVNQPQNFRFAGLTQSTLLDFKWGVQGVSFDTWDELAPNLASAMPEQPDKLTYVFKLRPGVKYHNGRVLNSEDIKYSFERYAKDPLSRWVSTYATFYDHIETPDPLTVIFKNKNPNLDTLQLIAGHRGEAYILNREHEEGPDALTKLVGTGPYTLASTSPPVSTFYRKNPDYFMKPYPYIDEIQAFVAPDFVKQEGDFYAKQVHMPWFCYIADRDDIVKNRPDAKHLEIVPYWPQGIITHNDTAPFNDARVRQALSMSIDRKKLREATNKGEGGVDQTFATLARKVLGTRTVAELGAAAKYWDYNIAEAKKLFAAAGVTLPIQSTMSHWDGAVVGQWFPDMATLIQAGWRQDGIANVQDNNQTIQQFQTTTQLGKYEGMGWNLNPGYASGIALGQTIRDMFYWGPNGEHSPNNNTFTNDPRLTDLATKEVQSFSTEERKGIFREMETIVADQQYRIVTNSASMNWFWDPSLANVNLPGDIGDRRFVQKWWFA